MYKIIGKIKNKTGQRGRKDRRKKGRKKTKEFRMEEKNWTTLT